MRWIIAIVVVVAAVVLLAPWWAGYFGPKDAAYAATWRPWRTHLSVKLDLAPRTSSNEVLLIAKYTDPWPGKARSPGEQIDFMTVKRLSPLLPWVVTEHATGP